MNPRQPTRFAVSIAAALLLAAGAALAQGVDRVYVLDCGWAHAPDQSRWSPGVNVGVPIDLSDNCYLVHHAQGGYLLWDTGITDAVSSMAPGSQTNPNAPVWHRPKTLVAQLAELGIAPADLKRIGLSHFHPDHSGNVHLFPNATVLMQRAEYEFAFAQPIKPFSVDQPVNKLEGDLDVFGDGSVVILSTPGHTPGHQSLFLHLAATGNLILSGDLAHFQSNWEQRRVPGFNNDKEKTFASMQRVADLLKERNAQLWINHDKPQSDRLKHSPQFYN